MPLKTHKSEYTILSILGVVTVLVVFWLVWRGMVTEPESESFASRTTYSAGPNGLLACYMLFERLEIPVERSHSTLRLSRLDDAGIVFLIDPAVRITAEEAADLRSWTARGGVLVTTEMIEGLGLHGQNDDERRPPSRRERNSRSRVSSPAANALSQPLARDILSVHFKTEAVFPKDRRDPCSPSDTLVPLFTDTRGMRIAEHRFSRGRVILLADGSFLTNGTIGRGDDGVLAVNLVSYAQAASSGQRVLFDEYHCGVRGYNQGLRILAGLLFTTSAGWTVLTLTAAGLLFLLYKGRQFGPRRSFGKQRRRSKMEHVYAVGATYRIAGAHHLALRMVYGWFRQRLTEQTGLAAGTPNRLIAEGLARRPGTTAAEYQYVLDECDRLLTRTKVTQREFATAIEQLARIEKETLNGSGNGKRPGR